MNRIMCVLFFTTTSPMLSMVQPPAQQTIINDPQFPQRLIAMPGDLLREVLFINAKFYNGTNVHRLAKGFLALAGTNKALSTHMKNIGMRVGIANKLPYTMGAVYFAQKITYMPGNQFKEIPRWLKSSSERFKTLKISELHENGCQLIRAIEKGDQAAIDTCFSFQNLPLNHSVNNISRTPLMQAIHDKRPEIAKRLLAAGANPNMKLHKNNGRFALFVAAHLNQTEVAKLLLECGAKVNMQDSKGHTAFMRAIAMRSHNETVFKEDVMQMIQLLITSGADIDLPSKEGGTALLTAVFHEDIDIVQFLIDSGANIDLKLENSAGAKYGGKTALDYARIRAKDLNANDPSIKNYEEIIAILEAASVKKEKQKIEQSKKP